MSEEFAETQEFSTADAAKYLGLALSTVKHHVHVTKNLVPDGRIGQNLVFKRSTLDRFKTEKPSPGRPKGSSLAAETKETA